MAEDREPEGGLHLYTQLSRRMGAIEECIALYESQRAVLKEIEDEKVETISRLARDKMEIMWDLQDLKLHLEDQRRKWQGKFLVATHNCAAEPTSAPGPPGGTVSCFEIVLVFLFFVSFFYHIIGVVGAHCDIYESSYKVKFTPPSLSLPPPPFVE
jgi:hypothetical protein